MEDRHMEKNKWVKLAICMVITFGFLGSNAVASTLKYRATLDLRDRVPGEFIVKSKSSGIFALQGLLASKLGISIKNLRTFSTNSRFHVIRVQEGADEAEFLSEINALSEVEYAEPNYILSIPKVHRVAADNIKSSMFSPSVEGNIPNDPFFSQLWGLHNTGQEDTSLNPGIAGADIGATMAWNTATGSRDVIVAVIDTGVDHKHEDLASNIYHNPGETGNGKETDGIDNDGNGFIDDHTGWNFVDSTNNSLDDNGHGTHCSGTIGAVANNGIGVAGVAWNVRIMPIKFLTAFGSGSLADAVQSIQYATAMGADITSNSYGGGGFMQSMEDAIQEAHEAGVLFIAAAGNDGLNSDTSPHYPAGYKVENVIAVAATNNKDEMTSWSTFGKKSVHIAAPGNNIYSTTPDDSYASFSGTSMATPHVVGAAALLIGHEPSLSHVEIKDRLLMSRDPKSNLARYVKHSGRLNINNAINEIYPPSDEPKEEDWVDGEAIEIIESAHPYGSDEDLTWVLKVKEDAKFIRLVFSRFELERKYDYLTISDARGTIVDNMTGVLIPDESIRSWYGEGNELHINFTSDSSLEKWGFQVIGYQYIPNEE